MIRDGLAWSPLVAGRMETNVAVLFQSTVSVITAAANDKDDDDDVCVFGVHWRLIGGCTPLQDPARNSIVVKVSGVAVGAWNKHNGNAKVLCNYQFNYSL